MNPSSKICSQLYQLANEYNGQNVVRNLSGIDVLIIQRLEEADYVLRRNSKNYRKNMAWLRQMLGASRFSEDGRAWEIRRQLTQTYFNTFEREKAFRLARNYAFTALDRLVAQSPTRETLDDDVLRTMTASVLIDNFFATKLEETELDLSLLAQLMQYGSEYSFIPHGRTGNLYRERLLQLADLRKKMLHALRYFRDGQAPKTPLLDDLLIADRRMEDRVVLEHELMAFIAAGSETSAATTGWLCYLLAKHPDIQERLRSIAKTFWLSPQPSWKELSSLEPLSQFVSETLRLYPPTPIIARYAIEPDQLGEKNIEAGQNVMISFIGVQHDRRFRPDPWALNIDNHKNQKISGENMAFSIGPRICGGKHFAMVEVTTFLSVFLDKVRMELTSDAPPVFHWKSQMLREGGQPVRFQWLDAKTQSRH